VFRAVENVMERFNPCRYQCPPRAQALLTRR
jgi:hypothetical protein